MAKHFESVLADLKVVGAYVQAQELAGVKVGDVQAQAAVARIRQLSGLSFVQATELTQAVADGPWTPGQKHELSTAVQGALQGKEGAKPRRELQQALHFEQYLTAAEWGALRSRALRAAKVQQLAARAWTLGLTCPSEPTVVRMTALILATDSSEGQVRPDSGAVFLEMKRAVKAMQAGRVHPSPHLVHFPPMPTQLPKDRFTYAYPDDPPVQVNMPELNGLAAGIRMRGKGSVANATGQGTVVDAIAQAVGQILQGSVMDFSGREHGSRTPREQDSRFALASAGSSSPLPLLQSPSSSSSLEPHPVDTPETPLPLALPTAQRPGVPAAPATPGDISGLAAKPHDSGDISGLAAKPAELAASMRAFKPSPLAIAGTADIEEMERELRQPQPPAVRKRPAAAPIGQPAKKPAPTKKQVQKPEPSGESSSAPSGASSSAPSAPTPLPKGFRRVPTIGCCKCRYSKNGCTECKAKVAKYRALTEQP